MNTMLGVEGKGQQMSFRMTHESFGPWRDSTVAVTLSCGSIVCYENGVKSVIRRNCRWKPVSTCRVNEINGIFVILTRNDLTERFYHCFFFLSFASHVCRRVWPNVIPLSVARLWLVEFKSSISIVRSVRIKKEKKIAFIIKTTISSVVWTVVPRWHEK